MYDYCLRQQPLGAGKDQPTKIYVSRNSGNQSVNIMTIQLRDAVITEIQFQTNPDDMPTEQLKLRFSEILWAYTVQGSDGRPLGVRSAGWSLRLNRPIGAFTD